MQKIVTGAFSMILAAFVQNQVLAAAELADQKYEQYIERRIVILATKEGAVGGEASVVEFYNPDLKNYFVTADPAEQAMIDTGAVGRWQRTGNVFYAGGPSQVCRFYGNGTINPTTGTIYGPNSHFYTADPAECASLKASFNPAAKSWKFESNDFAITVATNGSCPERLVPVYRAYNNGFAQGIDSNHRITSNPTSYQQTIAAGWSAEGVVMCAQAGAIDATICQPSSSLFSTECSPKPLPFTTLVTQNMTVVGPTIITVDTYRITAGDAPITFSSLRAIDSRGYVAASFSGLQEGQVIPAFGSVTFNLQSQFTHGKQSDITYSFSTNGTPSFSARYLLTTN